MRDSRPTNRTHSRCAGAAGGLSRCRLAARPAALCLVLLAAGGLSVAGCGFQEPIRTYNVAKSSSAGATTGSTVDPVDRMLAAYIVHGDKAWFFKMTGPKDAVAEQEPTFRELLESVRFADGSQEPTWSLPAGWEQRAGSSMRFATLVAPSDPELETSVIPLPYDDADGQQYALANLNRWRGQLQLAPIGPVELIQQTEQLEIDGNPAVYANLVGKMAEGGPPFASMRGGPMMGPQVGPPIGPTPDSDDDSTGPGPVAGPRPPTAGPKPPAAGPRPPSGSAVGSAAPPPADDGLTYELPEGWQRGGPSAFSRAAFTTSADGQTARITITSAGGDLLANVNRWRGQVGLPPITQAELDANREKLTVDGAQADFFDLAGPADADPRQTILGVIAPVDGATWFIKLMGDAELAEREKAKFKAFAESLKFDE